MKAIRSLTSLFSFAALVLVASDASAVYYNFAGRFTSNRGRIINIPVVGDAGCPATLTLMSGPGGKIVPATMTPAVHPITRGANTQPTAPVPTMGKAKGFDIGCVGHVPGKLLQTTGTMAKVGGGFVMPPKVWLDPFPSYVAAVEVKYAPPVLQLATSFKISGPAKLATVTAPLGGSMATGMNTAAFHQFKKGAYATQTGRVGSMFTWCFGNPGCVNIGQGVQPLIVKYLGGGNKFGGTMAYIITSGPNTSSLAIGLGGGVSGAVGFVVLAGMGSQPTGRGYADYLTDALLPGPGFPFHMSKVVTRPIVGKQMLITMVTGASFPFTAASKNYNYGFPFTTRPVLARNTGTAIGNPAITTITAKGMDTVTTMGKNRNISLVAGGLAATNIPPGGTQTPAIGSMVLTLPEPGATAQMLAGVICLLGIAAWRARKVR